MDLRLVRPAVIGGQEAVACSEDYRPCVCGNYPHVGVCVVCDAVTIDELQAVLERTAERDIFWLQVVPAPVPDGRVLVPGDVLRGKRVRAIDFYCPSPPHRLEIDPGAFRSSFDSTEHFYVMDCRLAGETRLEFLAGFHRLAHLYLYGSASAGGLAELPLLAALAELTVQKSAGLAQGFPARSLPKLRRLDLTDNALDDAQVDRILATLDASGIQVLSLAYNRLTLVPAPLASFARLSDLSLSGNRIASVGGGRLKLSAPKIDRLVLTNTSLGSIEPQAIEG